MEKEKPFPSTSEEAQEYFELAFNYFDRKEFERALELCSRAIQIDSKLADAHNLQGLILEELERREEACLAYREAVRLDPGFKDARENFQNLDEELRQEEIDSSSLKQGSGCVTILIFLLILGGIVSIWWLLSEPRPTLAWFFWLILTPVYFLAAWALWRMKTWGVILTIVLVCLDLLLNFVNYGCLGIIGLLPGVYVLYWLTTHFEDFD